MKFTRTAKAQWNGSGKEGRGTLSTESTVLQNTPYSFSTRFENDHKGTNPEELLGAAHAGCFAMQLSFLLGAEGFVPNTLDVTSQVHFEAGNIAAITLHLEGDVPEIDGEQFQQIATQAKEVCPISKALDTTINLKLTLKTK